jgi:hypothetical protein
MGAWGAGNFENDGALDYLGELTEQLAGEIDDILARGSAADADEDGESRLMPSVAILDTLCARFNGAPPQPDRVARWRDLYLAAFDRSMPGVDPSGTFMKERRPIVEQTFASLEARSKEFWPR